MTATPRTGWRPTQPARSRSESRRIGRSGSRLARAARCRLARDRYGPRQPGWFHHSGRLAPSPHSRQPGHRPQSGAAPSYLRARPQCRRPPEATERPHPPAEPTGVSPIGETPAGRPAPRPRHGRTTCKTGPSRTSRHRNACRTSGLVLPARARRPSTRGRPPRASAVSGCHRRAARTHPARRWGAARA